MYEFGVFVMLTDVFFRRYANRPMFSSVGQRERALFVQSYRIINEQIWKYYGQDGKVDGRVKTIWSDIHDRLSMEIGVKELSPRKYSNIGSYEINLVVEHWLNADFTSDLDHDVFIKHRLSFIELALKKREEQILHLNEGLPQGLKTAFLRDNARRVSKKPSEVPSEGYYVKSVRSKNKEVNMWFTENVQEFNERFKQAGMSLHYHNGFLQISQDELIRKSVEQPFWRLVSEPKWTNVSLDMATAIDLRDTGGRDPSFYAAKALESAIKIICENKQWATGREKGVSGFLDHLESSAKGSFIAGWERKQIQSFYSDIRNDIGHGPGSKEMPHLTPQQIDQTIEFCMSWIKSLITRL
jgi:hypothetical protein